MDLNDIGQQIEKYIEPTMWIVFAALLGIGYIIKRLPKIPNWAIYFVLLALGVICGLFIVGADIHGAIQGVLVAALAVFVHEGYKQTRKAVNGPENGA